MADTADFFRARLHGMVDHKHPLVVLSKRLPWAAIEQALEPHFARQTRPGSKRVTQDLPGEHEIEFGNGISPAGRPRLAVTHLRGLMVGARSFPGNPSDGHTLAAQLEQTNNLMQDLGRQTKQVVVDLGYRGVDADNPNVQIIHRGKYQSLTRQQRKWLKRRQAVEPLIAHTKADHGMQRC